MSSSDALLDLEHAGWRSLCDGSAGRFYGEMLRDDGVMVLANGVRMRRDEVVASLDGAPPWDDYEIDEVADLPLGAGVFALLYRGTGRRGETSFVAAMTSVYVHDGGKWRLALYQQTPVDAPD